MSRRTSDAVANFYQFHVDLAGRTLYLGGRQDPEHGETGVDAAMAESAIKGLYLLDRGGYEPITVLLNTIGGDVYHGLAIHDAVVACRSRVVIKVLGFAGSMGCVILQAADERLLSPNSAIMWHAGDDGFDGHGINLQRHAEQSQYLDEVLRGILLPRIREARSDFSDAMYAAEFNFDRYYSAHEAIQMGLADALI